MLVLHGPLFFQFFMSTPLNLPLNKLKIFCHFSVKWKAFLLYTSWLLPSICSRIYWQLLYSSSQCSDVGLRTQIGISLGSSCGGHRYLCCLLFLSPCILVYIISSFICSYQNFLYGKKLFVLWLFRKIWCLSKPIAWDKNMKASVWSSLNNVWNDKKTKQNRARYSAVFSTEDNMS